MRKLHGFTTVCVAVAAVIALSAAPDAAARGKKRKRAGFRVSPIVVADEDRQAVLDGNLAFGLDVYRELAAAPEGPNLAFSPIGLSAAMGMLLEAADGNTYAEMAGAMHLALPRERIGPAYQAVLSELPAERPRQYRLAVANGLWTRLDTPFRDEFVETLRTRYGAVARELDFGGDPEGARDTINAWGRHRTFGRIPQALPPGSITDLTAWVVANAVYFKARWRHPFDAADTAPRSFVLADGSIVETETMSVTAPLRTATVDGVRLVELPYRGEDADFLVAVPDDAAGLPALEAALSPETLAAWAAALPESGATVNLLLPKFTMEPDPPLDLVGPLLTLGMRDVFTAQVADLSRAVGAPGDTVVTGLLQSVFVAVDERGTEAAAVTTVTVGITSAPPTVAVDRPFVFLLRHRPTGTLLFTGRVTDPR